MPIILCTLLSAATCPSSAHASAETYVVVSGDTLSEIAKKHFNANPYAKSGGLVKILALNPDITNLHAIHIGQKIQLEKWSEATERKISSAISMKQAELRLIPQEEPRSQIHEMPNAVVEPALPVDPTELPGSTAPLDAESESPESSVLPEPEDKTKNEMGLELGYEYFSIAAVDRTTRATAILVSKLNPVAHLQWSLHWGRNWITATSAEYVAEKISNNTSSTSTLTGGTGSRFSFDLSLSRVWSERSKTTLVVGSTEKIFLRAATSSNIVADRVREGTLKVEHEQDLAKMSLSRAGVKLSGTVLGSGQGMGYSTYVGGGADISAYFKTKFENAGVELSTEFKFGGWRQNSSIVNQREQHMGITLGISKMFGN